MHIVGALVAAAAMSAEEEEQIINEEVRLAAQPLPIRALSSAPHFAAALWPVNFIRMERRQIRVDTSARGCR